VTRRTSCREIAQAREFGADGHPMHQHSSTIKAASRRRGFSLIEVVVLVCLVGILMAFALPRFTRVAHSARASEVVALSSSLRFAAEAAHVQYLAGGERQLAVSVDRKMIRLRNGYPDASASGIRNAVFDLDGFTISATDNAVIFAKSDAPAAMRCSVTYHPALESSQAAVVSGLDTSGC
jgi:type II secretory pathway pseudopilin PulG